jgi:hypothetical protein
MAGPEQKATTAFERHGLAKSHLTFVEKIVDKFI